MNLSLSEISTIGASFEEDVAAYAAAGFTGIGIWEYKLPEDDVANRALLREAGLQVANCIPRVPSILPLRLPGMEGPPSPAERIAALCASMRRLAAYEPESILCLTGPGDDPAAWNLVVDGLREVAAAARNAGVRFGLEPSHPAQRETVSFINTVSDALQLLDVARLPDVGLMVDTYNLWHEPPETVAAVAARVTGLHVADVPLEPDRTDRVLPGEGGHRSAAFVRALFDAGWDGFVDVEIFSTPERFWRLTVDDAARRAYATASALVQSVLRPTVNG
jgi:sugar phosphate isomerase/epimerase